MINKFIIQIEHTSMTYYRMQRKTNSVARYLEDTPTSFRKYEYAIIQSYIQRLTIEDDIKDVATPLMQAVEKFIIHIYIYIVYLVDWGRPSECYSNKINPLTIITISISLNFCISML